MNAIHRFHGRELQISEGHIAFGKTQACHRADNFEDRLLMVLEEVYKAGKEDAQATSANPLQK
jgi:hypothetical protein